MVIFRYLAKQVLVTMLAVTLVLLLIFMSGRFIKYLADAASGGISADVLFSIMAFRLPGFLELILPLGLFIGILLAYGRMYLESEMTVLHACGLSQNRLLMLTLGMASIVALSVGVISLYAAPTGMQKVEQIFLDQRKLTEFEMLAPGRFQSLKSGQRVTYTESLSNDKKQLNNVFISERSDDGKRVILLAAEKGTQRVDEKTGDRFLVLHNGTRFEGIPGTPSFQSVSFDKYGIKISLPDSVGKRKRKEAAIATEELWRSSDPEDRALLQWRISLPLLVPVVTILAVGLSRVNPRQGRFFHLLPAMLGYVLYLGLLIVARKNLGKEKLPEWIGLWGVHLFFFIIALAIFYRDKVKLMFSKTAPVEQEAAV